MQSQWNNDGNNLPPRIQWTPPKSKSSKGLVVGIVVGLMAVVIAVGVVIAVARSSSAGNPPADDANDGSKTTSGDETSEADKTDDPDSGSYPKVGEYEVVHVATGLCLTTGPEPNNEERQVIVLGKCGKTYPKVMTWKPVKDRQYTVGLAYTKDNWNACLTADKPADEMGYLFAGQDCGKKDNKDLQTFELSDKGDKQYGIAVAKTGMCLGPLEEKAKKGMAISTVECGDDRLQLFTLKKS
ncbi:hypothetical protein [Stackebrandtia nassauensis]|uniref:Uncharacterized protein n=1 Tax=Stackebrandtia nassauensis (strain DSM 44728 / CIP 108903 / NRRL B-16338 / NBRC 102104 / LLR-40K-21) TaxID=446470 RepID=D3Q6V6_STANL|nr:hypothetical protein [Stackebrandtia nassauensis]ADD40355.1 hypothetical protein Snas_0642 [Stackebrandtia nassauensis DSM 44728]